LVVTGGAGFIGSNLCRALSASGGIESIVVLDDLSTGRAGNLDGIDGIDLVVGTVLDAELVRSLVSRADAVVHLAARPSVTRSLEDPLATNECNVLGTLRVLEAARHGGRPQVIVASSSSVYGANRLLPAPETVACSPLSPYAASKLAAEAYALSYSASFDLPVLAFRFFNVFGPFQRADHAYAAVIPTFVSAALQDKPLPVHGDGKQTRDFTFVGSVTSMLLDALSRGVTCPQPVNLAFGERCSLLELASLLELVVERPLDLVHLEPRPGDVRDSQADTSRLRTLFPGVMPTPLVDGLRETVDWARTEIASPAGTARIAR